MSFAFKKRANLPYNRRGRIAPYTKDGGRKAQEKGGSDSGTFSNPSNRFKSRNHVPTMDQIQAGIVFFMIFFKSARRGSFTLLWNTFYAFKK